MFFIIKIIILFLLLQIRTPVHELGHLIAIYVSKGILKYKGSLGIRLCLLRGNGRTESYLYEYIANLKCKSIIKFNAISGILTESIVYLIIVICSCRNYQNTNNILYLNILALFAFLLALKILTVVFLNKFKDNDIKYFYYPETYEYKYNPNFIGISLKIFKSIFNQYTTYIYLLGSLLLPYLFLLYLSS